MEPKVSLPCLQEHDIVAIFARLYWAHNEAYSYFNNRYVFHAYVQ